MAQNIIGFGSFFHSVGIEELEELESNSFYENHKLFYTGRHAIKYLIDRIGSHKNIGTIWLPKYYCQHVTAWISHDYKVDFYFVDPFDIKNQTELDSRLFENENDIVILNNFWGVFQYKIPNLSNRAIVIEDHSHGWLSTSCMNSNADLCISSLRKTLPIPLGGIAWVPGNSALKFDFKENDFEGSIEFIDDFLEKAWHPIELAMDLKAKCQSEKDKQKYLSLFGAAEEYLHHQHRVVPVSEQHKALMNSFLTKDYMGYKRRNLKYLKSKLAYMNSVRFIDGHNQPSFGLHILFEERSEFEELKSHLISNQIYPSELWPNNFHTSRYKYLMNIHIDYRYQMDDLDYISETLICFFKSSNEFV